MAAHPIYQAFSEANCNLLLIHTHIKLKKTTLARLRDCFGGKRRYLPYRFGAVYSGDSKERIGLFAQIRRIPKDKIALEMRWFETKTSPPEEFGKFGDLIECLAGSVGDLEASVLAIFSYDAATVSSIFRPIHLPEQSTIFDEITGFTGAKRNPQGKLLYEMDISLGEKRLEHIVRFSQTIKPSETLPLSLVETASRISAVGLRPKAEV